MSVGFMRISPHAAAIGERRARPCARTSLKKSPSVRLLKL